MINFVQSASIKNHELEVSDWLLKKFNHGETFFHKNTLFIMKTGNINKEHGLEEHGFTEVFRCLELQRETYIGSKCPFS